MSRPGGFRGLAGSMRLGGGHLFASRRHRRRARLGSTPGAVLRWALALVFVLWVAGEASRGLVQWSLPALRAALAWTAPDYTVLQLGIVDEARGALVAAVVRPARSIIIGERAVLPDPQAMMVVTATLGSIALPLWTALLLALAWPGPAGETLLRLPLLVPLVALVLALDTPWSLAAWMWLTQLRQHDPGAFSMAVAWNTFLGGGGRLLLGGVAGAGAVMLARLATAHSAAATRA